MTKDWSPELIKQYRGLEMDIQLDTRTIRARKFASQIMAIIGDCISDKVGAESRLIDAAYQVDAEIVAMRHPEPTNISPTRS